MPWRINLSLKKYTFCDDWAKIVAHSWFGAIIYPRALTLGSWPLNFRIKILKYTFSLVFVKKILAQSDQGGNFFYNYDFLPIGTSESLTWKRFRSSSTRSLIVRSVLAFAALVGFNLEIQLFSIAFSISIRFSRYRIFQPLPSKTYRLSGRTSL